MLYKKTGLPEESELVLCTVTKVLPNSVFVTLDEYGIDGLIHISEVSPGRIRNIRDFVKEGKKVVCKILRINVERGQVDV
jgi:translation initiation factor 2 subunit 1